MRAPRLLLALAATLLVTLPAASALIEAPPAAEPPATAVEYPEGSYQLADGSWAIPLKEPSPPFYTPEVHEKVLAAAEKGLGYDFEAHEEVALTTFLFVRPGAWMLYPSGCTMNFIYGTPGSYQIGTAGHCGNVGQTVSILAAPNVAVFIGKIDKSVNQGIGADGALVNIDPQWQGLVDPNVGDVQGPQGGAYPGPPTPRAAVPLKHVGHGVGVGTGGTPRAGLSLHMAQDYFYFYGGGVFGDSGSPVLHAGSTQYPLGQAVGVLTHLVVGSLGATNAGTRMSVIPATVVDGDVDPRP